MAAPAEHEQIIRAELRQPIEQLVRQVVVELVHEQLNGAGPAAEGGVSGPENAQEPTSGPSLTSGTTRTSTVPATKQCRICGQTKAASEFDRGRRQCKRCRRDRVRDRAPRGADDEEPHQPVVVYCPECAELEFGVNLLDAGD